MGVGWVKGQESRVERATYREGHTLDWMSPTWSMCIYTGDACMPTRHLTCHAHIQCPHATPHGHMLYAHMPCPYAMPICHGHMPYAHMPCPYAMDKKGTKRWTRKRQSRLLRRAPPSGVQSSLNERRQPCALARRIGKVRPPPSAREVGARRLSFSPVSRADRSAELDTTPRDSKSARLSSSQNNQIQSAIPRMRPCGDSPQRLPKTLTLALTLTLLTLTLTLTMTLASTLTLAPTLTLALTLTLIQAQPRMRPCWDVVAPLAA